MSDIKVTNSIAKAKLIEEWFKRKGNESWDLVEIAELIADATWLAEERIIKLLEDNCKCGIWRDHLIGCPHEVAIALIKGEQ